MISTSRARAAPASEFITCSYAGAGCGAFCRTEGVLYHWMPLVRPPFRHALLVGAVLTTTLAAPASGQVDPPTPIDEVRPIRHSPKADAGVPAATHAPSASPLPALPAAKPPSEQLPKPLVAPTATDEALFAAWHRWRKGIQEPDAKLAEEAQRELLALKGDLGIADLDAFAIGFTRAAQAKVTSNDAMGAVALAGAAVE